MLEMLGEIGIPGLPNGRELEEDIQKMNTVEAITILICYIRLVCHVIKTRSEGTSERLNPGSTPPIESSFNCSSVTLRERDLDVSSSTFYSIVTHLQLSLLKILFSGLQSQI